MGQGRTEDPIRLHGLGAPAGGSRVDRTPGGRSRRPVAREFRSPDGSWDARARYISSASYTSTPPPAAMIGQPLANPVASSSDPARTTE